MIEKKATIEARLAKYPHLKARMEALLDIAENTSGSLELADDAEEQLIIEIKKAGQEVLQTWAKLQEEKQSEKARTNRNVTMHSKKNFTGNQHLDK